MHSTHLCSYCPLQPTGFREREICPQEYHRHVEVLHSPVEGGAGGGGGGAGGCEYGAARLGSAGCAFGIFLRAFLPSFDQEGFQGNFGLDFD